MHGNAPLPTDRFLPSVLQCDLHAHDVPRDRHGGVDVDACDFHGESHWQRAPRAGTFEWAAEEGDAGGDGGCAAERSTGASERKRGREEECVMPQCECGVAVLWSQVSGLGVNWCEEFHISV